MASKAEVKKITHKPSKVFELLRYMINNNQNLESNGGQPVALEVIGEAGIGKTSGVISLANDMGLAHAKLNLAQMDELAELIGFPIREFMTKEGLWVNEVQVRDNPSKYHITDVTRTTWCPPKWVPQDTHKGGILILDDWTRADPRFIQAVMELIDRGEYVSWKLPKGWTIVLTGNPQDGDYSVNSIDDAQRTRFMSIEMRFDKDDWAMWAEGKVDGRCINFILRNPEAVTKKTPIRLATKFFDTISGIDSFSSSDSLERINLIGDASVGTEFTQRFITFLNEKLDKLVPPEEIMETKDFAKVRARIKESIGESTSKDYNSAAASIICTRLINFLIMKINEEKHSPGSFKRVLYSDRLDQLMTDKDLVHKDILAMLSKFMTKYNEHFNRNITKRATVNAYV